MNLPLIQSISLVSPIFLLVTDSLRSLFEESPYWSQSLYHVSPMNLSLAQSRLPRLSDIFPYSPFPIACCSKNLTLLSQLLSLASSMSPSCCPIILPSRSAFSASFPAHDWESFPKKQGCRYRCQFLSKFHWEIIFLYKKVNKCQKRRNPRNSNFPLFLRFLLHL